jgi:hypothetical protein
VTDQPRILAIDPGAAAGFAWVAEGWRDGVTADPNNVPAGTWDELVIEDQNLRRFIYRNGRRVPVNPKSQITLIRTAERLLLKYPAVRQYRIQPDDWRAVLWPGSRRLPKPTVVARLVQHEPWLLGAPYDVIEARGILRAWLSLTAAQKKKYLVKA